MKKVFSAIKHAPWKKIGKVAAGVAGVPLTLQSSGANTEVASYFDAEGLEHIIMLLEAVLTFLGYLKGRKAVDKLKTATKASNQE